MRFTLSWLKKFLATDRSLAEITDTLTDLGLEVEEVIDRTGELAAFEVAEIISARRHPAADRLQVCEVNSSSGLLQIVCGAPNARAGIKVVLAKVGVLIPNGNFKIKESEIRGVKSSGMLCSEQELEVGCDEGGIIELPPLASVGENFIKYYGLDDPVIHINVTPNRGDALSVYGIARDLAARGIGMLKEPVISEIKPHFSSDFPVTVKAPELCTQFLALEVRDLTNRPSPDWLKSLLSNVGIGSISAIVDVTNYICLTLGQPMHAYDADKLQDGLIIEQLRSGDSTKALNGKEYRLEAGDLVIRDGKEVQCLAGIIGSEASSITLDTKRIILEAAVFDEIAIARTGRRLALQTDSRYRFERKVDDRMTEKALKMAAAMVIDICGGKPSAPLITRGATREEKVVEISSAFIKKITGLSLEVSEISNILTSLGFSLEMKGEAIAAAVPSWRHDISSKEDLVEEVVRIHGYDKVKAVALPSYEAGKVIPKEEKKKSDLKRLMAYLGYDEVVSWSFMDQELAGLFGEIKDELIIQNPISSDLGYMRATIVPGLLTMASRNSARGVSDMAIFEIGPVFRGTEPHDEDCHLTATWCGARQGGNCHEPSRAVDVFDLKADLEVVLKNMGLALESCRMSKCDLGYYHPGRSATLFLGKNIIAHFGQIHPRVINNMGLEIPVMAFEINLKNVPLSKERFGRRDEFTPSPFQVSERDYAFVMDKSQAAGEVASYIKGLDKQLVKAVEIFDVYQGDKVEPGKKSVAIKVYLQSPERTLTEEDLKTFSDKVVSTVEQKFAAKLRSS